MAAQLEDEHDWREKDVLFESHEDLWLFLVDWQVDSLLGAHYKILDAVQECDQVSEFRDVLDFLLALKHVLYVRPLSGGPTLSLTNCLQHVNEPESQILELLPHWRLLRGLTAALIVLFCLADDHTNILIYCSPLLAGFWGFGVVYWFCFPGL